MPSTLLCVHRGGDNDTSMYWCQGTIDANGDINWSGDQRFMAGQTHSSEGPALAIYNNRIICAHRDAETGRLMISYWDAGLREWRMRGPITTTAPCTPGLFVGPYYGQNDKLFCFYEGDYDNMMYWAITDDPLGEWQFNLLAANKARGRCSGIRYADTTFCVHRGHDHTQQLYWARYDTGNWWHDDVDFRVEINGGTPRSSSGPAAANFNNQFFLVHRGWDYDGTDDTTIYTNRYRWDRDYLWPLAKEYRTGNRSNVGPTLVVVSNNLYCIYPSADDDRLQWTRWRSDNTTWLPGIDFGGHRSASEAAVIAIDNPL